MLQPLPYILAVSLQELFPSSQIQQIVTTPECFFCDVLFPGRFSSEILPRLEERMRAWIVQKVPCKTLTMIPSNAAQMLKHYGDINLAEQIKHREGEVNLIQLDRFFFETASGGLPSHREYALFFKLVCFWPLRRGVRILGAKASSKSLLKEHAQRLKALDNPQNILEARGFISWMGDELIWEMPAEKLKTVIKKKILEIYQGFDEVRLPDLDQNKQQKLLTDWVHHRTRGGVQWCKKKISTAHAGSREPWDPSDCLYDQGWGRGPINSYLHLIAKFLKIFNFDYEVVGVGNMDADLKEELKGLALAWHVSSPPYKGRCRRLEFQVRDRLGRPWTISTLEWDRKKELVQVTLCTSLERCIALFVDLDSKTLLNRLKQLEN